MTAHGRTFAAAAKRLSTVVSKATKRPLPASNTSAVADAFAAAVAKSAASASATAAPSAAALRTTLPAAAAASRSGAFAAPSEGAATSADELPQTYDQAAIERYWGNRQLEVASRWAEFVRLSLPLITRATTEALSGALRGSPATQRALASDLVDLLEKLGPAFVKAGQSLSIRPDVVGPDVAEILARLQDAVKPFEQEKAEAVLAEELASMGLTADGVFAKLPMEVRPVDQESTPVRPPLSPSPPPTTVTTTNDPLAPSPDTCGLRVAGAGLQGDAAQRRRSGGQGAEA